MQNSFEGFFAEINLRKKKWLLSCSYNPNRNKTVNHMKNINPGLDQFTSFYDNIVLLGDSNVEPGEENMHVRLSKNSKPEKSCKTKSML